MTTSVSASAGAISQTAHSTRWVQLGLWFVTMMMVGTFQYGWSWFVGPIDSQHHWGRTAINTAFTVFIFTEAFSTIPIGVMLQRYGLRVMVFLSGLLLFAAGCIFSIAESLATLYLGAFVGGVGVGVISCAAPYGAVKWFPEKRGMATGIVVTGFVAGSLLTGLAVNWLIGSISYQNTFLIVGVVQGITLWGAALFLRSPRHDEVHVSRKDEEPEFRSIREVLATPEINRALRSTEFWLLFAIFTLVGAGGLMATAQFALIAGDFKVANVPVHFLWFTMAALPLAFVFDRWMNALCRPFFGWLSDIIGREFTMCLAFGLEAVAIALFISYAHNPLAFVLLSGLIFFGWGELFTVMPTTVADIFGTRYATAIYGILYAAKGVAAIFVPIGNYVMSTYGLSWSAVFYTAVVFDVIAVILALVLKSYRANTSLSA